MQRFLLEEIVSMNPDAASLLGGEATSSPPTNMTTIKESEEPAPVTATG